MTPLWTEYIARLEQIAAETPPPPGAAELRRHIVRVRAIGYGQNERVPETVWRYDQERFIPEIRGLREPLPLPSERKPRTRLAA
jgi:hypothetical protein